MATRKPAKRWFNTIREDPTVFYTSLPYFWKVIEGGPTDVPIKGLLEDLVADNPGLMLYYDSHLTDASQIRKWLEAQHEIEYGKKWIWLATSPEAKAQYGDLKVTDVREFIKADPDLADLTDMIRTIAAVEGALEAIVESIKNRSIHLTNITNIRKEGLQEIWVDPTKETRNE